ncbi:MAG: hypothetical protein ABI767_14835 [Rhodanobacter sp.]
MLGSCRVGVASGLLDSEGAAETLLCEAEEAQYMAKRAGRNIVRDTNCAS